MTIQTLFRRILRVIGIDRAVGFTVIGRVWSSVAGLVGLFVVGKFLSPNEQGYYYTFYSLLALQTFVELGLSNVILQFASHEAAHLELTPNGGFIGPKAARSRLASILRFSLKWYGVAAILFTFLMLMGGFAFFNSFSAREGQVAWQIPWTLTVLAAAAFLLLTPLPAFLQGCGFVADVAQCRLFQALAAHASLWISIVLGVGLASAAIFAAVNVLAMFLWLAVKYWGLFASLLDEDQVDTIPWRTEMWPYQWRIAVSWLCGYFIFQIFTPLVFAFHGSVEAGRMGMSLTLASAVSAMGMSWLSTKAPRLGALVSLRQFRELDSVFFRSMKLAVAVSGVCAAAVIILCLVLHAIHHPFADRFLGPWPLSFLLLASIVNLIVGAEATYLRAFKQEPFLIVSLVNAVLTALCALVLSKYGTPSDIALGYLAVVLFVGVGLGTWVFRTKRRVWRFGATDNCEMPVPSTTSVACAAA